MLLTNDHKPVGRGYGSPVGNGHQDSWLRTMDLCRQVVRWRWKKAAMRRWASLAEGSW
jgi:hypothetical protein